MLFRVYNKEKISNKALIVVFVFFFLHKRLISLAVVKKLWGEDTFICSTLIKSLQVEFKSIITSSVIAG